jgi:histidinol-phosphatase
MAEILIDPIVAPYDIAATKICVEEAGGRLTDIHGIESIYNKTAVITNGLVHDNVLEILNSWNSNILLD